MNDTKEIQRNKYSVNEKNIYISFIGFQILTHFFYQLNKKKLNNDDTYTFLVLNYLYCSYSAGKQCL